MFKRKTTALFLLMATMIFLIGISVVSATSDNGTVIQDNTYSYPLFLEKEDINICQCKIYHC